MSLVVKPDPKRSSGGYAVLQGVFSASEVWVVVFNVFSERYLGQHGWQSAKVEFGPYAVDETDPVGRIVIGPEIVNHLEEYSDLRFQIGTLTAEINWPDTISQRPGAAVVGAIRSMEARAAPADLARRVVLMPEEQPDAAAAEAPATAAATEAGLAEPVQPTHRVEPQARRRGPHWLQWLGLLLLLLAGLGAAAWFLWLQPPAALEEQVVVPPAAITRPVAPAEAATELDTCSETALRASAELSFSDVLAAFQSCGDAVSPNVALSVIEDAAERSDPMALSLFGALYDGDVSAAGIEDSVGLTFNDSPSQAAEYYSRAVDGGDAEAGERLAGVCARLVSLNDTISQNAHQEYCSL